jgi:hypothetical protein
MEITRIPGGTMTDQEKESGKGEESKATTPKDTLVETKHSIIIDGQ